MATKRISTDLLEAWLDRVNARECWTAKIPGGDGAYVQGLIIKGQLAVVLRLGGDDGWDLLIPASSHNDIERTLNAAALALGVECCYGLCLDRGTNLLKTGASASSDPQGDR